MVDEEDIFPGILVVIRREDRGKFYITNKEKSKFRRLRVDDEIS